MVKAEFCKGESLRGAKALLKIALQEKAASVLLYQLRFRILQDGEIRFD